VAVAGVQVLLEVMLLVLLLEQEVLAQQYHPH
jgi:hypothetical protein